MTRTQLGNAFGPGREVDVCPVCGVVVLVPRDGEPDWPGMHACAEYPDWHDEWCDANGCRCHKCPCSCGYAERSLDTGTLADP